MAYDADKAKTICDLVAEQEIAKSLRQACSIVGLAPSTFLLWCDTNEALAEQYARANKIATDLQFEEFNALNDERPPTVKGFTDAGWAQWQRMRLDNKKWAMSKRRPSKYGDKVAHTGDDGGPIQFVVTRAGSKEKS